MRVTVELAETLVEVQDLVGPVAEAAQEWLEAREDGHRELISEARAELDLALADSSELQCLVRRLARLTGSREVA